MLTNMGCNLFAVGHRSVLQDPLNQIVAVLVAGNVDERDPGTIRTAFTNTVKIPVEKFVSSNLEALFDDLGSILIHAVFGGILDDDVDSSTAIHRGTVFADVLDAPVSKLTMSDEINVFQNFVDARALEEKSVNVAKGT